ncbi:MAG: GHKL domain-containing protein [Clostridia bacterium]|nr:GHKL domain-containing protein [Clostridia bacterium]
MTNFIWISSYIADLLFIWLFFKRSAYTPQRQNKWLKPILSVLLVVLYLNDSFITIPNAAIRICLRAVIYFIWIFAAEGVPARPAVYAAVFWTGVYTMLQNVFFGPLFYDFFSGRTSIIGSRLVSQIVLSIINLAIRFVYFGILSRLLPFEGIAGAQLSHIIFAAGMCALSVYTKDTGARMRQSFSEGSPHFTVYFILLHVAMLLALVIFEYSRRRDVERASLQIQNNTTKALMQSIQDRQMSEDAVRTLRHDLKNHAISLQLLLEHGETDKAMEYLENFRNAAKNPVDGFETGSQLLNGLLRQKLSPAKERGIDVECDLDFTEGSFIDNFDLCVIMGNILDNAVEACDALPEGSQRYIKLSGGPAANYVNIEVENSSARKSHLLDGLPATSKADKAMHGFGLRSVRSVVERYNGVMNIEQNDSSYSISLMIPKPKN